MGRRGDEQIAKSAPHHWADALIHPLEDGREINKSAPDALKLSRPTQKAPNSIAETSRNTTVIYSKWRRATANLSRHITPNHHPNRTEFDLPLLHNVVRKSPGTPPSRANSWRRIKCRNAAARRKDLSQTHRAFAHQTFEHMAQTPTRNRKIYLKNRKKRIRKLAAVQALLICAVLYAAAELDTCEDGAKRRPHPSLHPSKIVPPIKTL
jgi:hypothetical protein